MAAFVHFTEIRAWREARTLVRGIYAVTARDPLRTEFALRDQVRSAAVSVMSNIAEGFGRRTPVEFARFLDISRASACEVQSLLFVCEDIGAIPSREAEEFRQVVEDILRMISGLPSYLREGCREPETEYAP